MMAYRLVKIAILSWMVLMGVPSLQAGGPSPVQIPGEVIYEVQFNSPESLKKWPGLRPSQYAPGEGIDAAGCLKFVCQESQSTLYSLPLDVDKLRGRPILLEAIVKGKDIAKPPQKYLGIKLMLHVKDELGDDHQDHLDKRTGSFDWVRMTNFMRVPLDAKSLNAAIGLQGTTGEFFISSIKITVLPEKTVAVDSTPAGSPAKPVKQVTQWRGTTMRIKMNEKDYSELASWKPNLVRYMMTGKVPEIETMPGTSVEKWQRWAEVKIDELDKAIEACRSRNIKVLIALFNMPNGEHTELISNILPFTRESEEDLLWIWEKMAAKYKDDPTVWGYDLVNEPLEYGYAGQAGVLDWNSLAEKVALAIRKIDPVKPIVIEPSGYGTHVYHKFDIPNIVYSVHFYSPGSYSHQGIYGHPAGVVYPGEIEGREWNKETIRKALAPALEFQRKYNVPFIVGEFSAARWAPNSQQYIKDCIDLFEEYGWDWCYHSFREANIWDAEWGANRDEKQRPAETERKTLLKSYFERNKN